MLLDKKILLRVTESERERIAASARLRGLSVNDFLRSVALQLPTEPAMEYEQRLAALEARVNTLSTKPRARQGGTGHR